MLGNFETDCLQNVIMSGKVSEGLKVATSDGRPAHLAVVDEDGKVIEAGNAVANTAWAVAMKTFENFWQGNGHLRVFSQPPGQQAMSSAEATTTKPSIVLY